MLDEAEKCGVPFDVGAARLRYSTIARLAQGSAVGLTGGK